MKVKALMVIFVSSLMIMLGVGQISAESQSDEHVKKIAKCQSKTILKTSRSENLQLTAEIAADQVRFLSLNKDTLVNEMMEKGIGPKPYKIEHYLNSRFYEVYK